MNVFKRFYTGLTVISCVALSLGPTAAPALASTLTFSFTGDVTHVDNPLKISNGGVFSTSQLMSGTFTASTTDMNGGGNQGDFNVTGFTLDIGGGAYTATMGTSGLVEIRTGADKFDLTVNSPNGANVNFMVPRLFDFNLEGPNGTITSELLTNNMTPNIASFTEKNLWRLVFGPTDSEKVVKGQLTSLQAVPLPPSVVLFGAGLVALVGLGAGRGWRERMGSLNA
jgi:hypothetical protein